MLGATGGHQGSFVWQLRPPRTIVGSFYVQMALGHLMLYSVTCGKTHGFSSVFCCFLKKLAYRDSQIAYRGSPIAIGRSRLPIGRSRKFIGRSRLWIGRSRCLMHAGWCMGHGSRLVAHGQGRPGEAHGSWPGAGPAWVGWGERTQVWFCGAEPDTETAPAPFQPLGSLSVPLC